MSPLVFNKYEIIRRLAAGGMGEIFLARQRGVAGFERLVILKTMLPQLARTAGNVEAFLDEARVAATLNHPNIISVFEVGHWEGAYFIAMEYVEGESLYSLQEEMMARGRILPFPVTAQIIHDAARALDHAHHARDPRGEALKIVHRDVSPHNIMVRVDGVTKVLDFGIAKATNRAAQSTKTGILKGKLGYMTPEMVMGASSDSRSDQYALGIVLWELCAGRTLLGNQQYSIAALLQMTKPVPPLSEVREDVPKEIDSIARRMLQPKKEDRFERCLDVSRELENYIASSGGASVLSEVAALVEEICGEAIKSRTRDLTPRQENFLISLGRSSGEAAQGRDGEDTAQHFSESVDPLAPTLSHATSPSVTLQAGTQRRGPKRAAAVSLALIAITAAGAVFYRASVYRANVGPGGALPLAAPISRAAPLPVVSLDAALPSAVPVSRGEPLPPQAPLSVEQPEAHVATPANAARVVGTDDVRAARRPTPKQARTSKGASDISPAGSRKGGPGYLSLTTTPHARVSIDGGRPLTSPLFRYELTPGKHTLRMIEEQQNIDVTRDVDIQSDETTKLKIDLRK